MSKDCYANVITKTSVMSNRHLPPNLPEMLINSRQSAVTQRGQLRKNTSTACNNCRQKRTKCSGNSIPCANCDRLNIPCHIDEASDQRRRAVTMARLRQLENDQQLLETLLTRLSEIPPGSTDSHITRIRQDAYNEKSRRSAHGHKRRKLTLQNEMKDHQLLDESHETLESTSRTDGNIETEKSDLENTTPGSTNSENDDRLANHSSTHSQQESVEKHPIPGTTQEVEHDSSGLDSNNIVKKIAVRSFGNLPMSAAIQANHYPVNIQHQQLSALHGPIEACLPLNIRTEPQDPAYAAVQSVLSFLAAARGQILQAGAARTVLSMDDFDLSLFYRERTPEDGHTVANWACEWGKAWMGFPIAMRLAAVHFVGSLMRWLIMPCKETYEMLPTIMRPLPCQLLIPHTMDIDLWGAPPAMRAAQVLYGGGWLLRATSRTQKLNWPGSSEDCVLETTMRCTIRSPGAAIGGDGSPYRLVKHFSPKFIQSVEDVKNWSVSRDLLYELPGLLGCVQLHDHD